MHLSFLVQHETLFVPLATVFQNITLTPDKKVNDVIYGTPFYLMTYTGYNLLQPLKQSGFFTHPVYDHVPQGYRTNARNNYCLSVLYYTYDNFGCILTKCLTDRSLGTRILRFNHKTKLTKTVQKVFKNSRPDQGYGSHNCTLNTPLESRNRFPVTSQRQETSQQTPKHTHATKNSYLTEVSEVM